MSKPQPSFISQHKVALAAVAVLALTVCGVAAASQLLLVDSNHITGTPEPTPSPTAQPTVAPEQNVIGATLTSNMTGTFFLGDTIHLTATLNVTQAGVNVQLWNLGYYKETLQSDSNGVVTWDRAPTVAFDYYVRVENTVP